MGMVGLTLHVMPEDAESNIHDIKKHITSIHGVRQVIEKPIGFGLMMLDVLLVFDDKVGAGNFDARRRAVN